MSVVGANRTIPYYSSDVLGREEDIARISALINDDAVRLVTITGSAGIGKTRLATELALNEMQRGRDVLFVPLAAIENHELVLREIATSLELQGDDLHGLIHEKLSNFDGLVVLDNFEQVADAATDIAAILPANPALTLLVTSQRPLHLDGERIVRLHPLQVPESTGIDGIPSVELLIQRAEEQDLSMSGLLEDESAIRAVAEICRKLDGIPLALELAASRIASLTPEVVLNQLNQGQEILRSQRRDWPERHRTMQSAIAWSYDLLPSGAQRVLLWLSPFTAGFDLKILEKVISRLGVSASSYEIIDELMNASLINRVSGGENPWYSMLVSIREFCLRELNASGQRADAQALVADYVVEIADATESTLTSAASEPWLKRLEKELPTIQSAIAWELDHQSPYVPMRVSMGAWRYLERAGRWKELVGWVDEALKWRDELDNETLIGGLLAKLTALEEARDLISAKQTGEEIARLLETDDFPALRTTYHLRMGTLEHDQLHLEKAEEHFMAAAQLGEERGHLRDASAAWANLALLAYSRADWENAEAWMLRSKQNFTELGDQQATASSLSNLAAIAMQANQFERGETYLNDALEITRRLNLRRDMIYVLVNLGSLYMKRNELNKSVEATEESISLAAELQYPVMEATGILRLAEIELLRGNHVQCGTLVASALSVPKPEELVRVLPEAGITSAGLLTALARYDIAAAILGKTEALMPELSYSMERHEIRNVATMRSTLLTNSATFEADLARGAAWTTQEFITEIKRWCRRIASSSHIDTMQTMKLNPPPIPELSPREQLVLDLLVEGGTTQSMAESLSLSPRTITTHLGNIMAKFGVSSRLEVIAMASRTQPE